MDKSNRFSQSFTERENIVNPLTANPNARAIKVLDILKSHPNWKELDQWDLVCFASEFLGGALPIFPFLKEVVKKLGQEVYNAHYYYPDKIGICPSEALLSAEKARDITETLTGQLEKSLEHSLDVDTNTTTDDTNHKQ